MSNADYFSICYLSKIGNMLQDKKIMLDAFQQYLLLDYHHYCTRHEADATISAFITFVIDKNLLSSKAIRKYTIMREFKSLYPESGKKKTTIVNGLADRFHVSERSIWAMLKKNI